MKHLVISALWLLLALTNSESHSDALKASKKNLLSIVATYKNNHFQRVFKSEKYDFITYTEQPDSASTAHYFFEISTTGYQPDENNSYKKGFYETSTSEDSSFKKDFYETTTAEDASFKKGFYETPTSEDSSFKKDFYETTTTEDSIKGIKFQ